MTLTGLIWFLIVGLIAGWLASVVMKGGRRDLLTYLIIGVIGALLGGWLFGLVGLAATGLIGSIIMAFVGAVVLILLLRMIRRV